MTTTAQYATTCPGCGDSIEPGQRIASTDDGWMHAHCAETPSRPPRPDHPVCLECFIMHPPGTCDA